MSTIVHEIYHESTIKLVRSFVIKSHDMAKQMNVGIEETFPLHNVTVDDNNIHSWKYYLNISGEYHALDAPMTITSLDTQTPIEFNKANLLIHLETAKAYQIGSREYNALVDRFPSQKLLIRGIINPVDIDVAIESPDWTILNWDASEVESTETDLIEGVQAWLHNWTKSMFNPDFVITDELYLVSFFGTIVSYLPTVVQMVRYEKSTTFRAHSFHIWNYLDSHGYLGNYRDYLTTKQAMWLFRNIRWVRANTANLDTFDALVDAILTSRNIPLGRYHIEQHEGNMPRQIRPDAVAIRTPINLLDISEPRSQRSINYVIDKETSLAKDNALYTNDHIDLVKLEYSRAILNSYPTKTYESEMIDYSNHFPYVLTDVQLWYWIYLSATNQYNSVITIAHPQTGESIPMSVKDAFIAWMWMINRLNGVELDVIPTMEVHAIRVPVLPTASELSKIVDGRYVSEALIQQLLDRHVDITTPVSTSAFNTLCVDIHAAMLNQRFVVVCQDDMWVRGYMDGVLNACYMTTSVPLTSQANQTFLSYFSERGFDFADISQPDMELLTVELYNLALGNDDESKKSLSDIQGALLRLMHQLGTYATHYIRTINDTPAIVIDTPLVRVGDVTRRHWRHHTVPDIAVDWFKLRTLHHRKLTCMTRLFDTMTRVKRNMRSHHVMEVPMEIGYHKRCKRFFSLSMMELDMNGERTVQ